MLSVCHPLPRFTSRRLVYWCQRNQSYKRHCNTHNRLHARKLVSLRIFLFDRTCTTEWPNVCSAVLTICVCLPLCLRVAEAEELNNRLQATKQRVSELERTLSSVSTQQKQFEKVTEIALISRCQPNSLTHD